MRQVVRRAVQSGHANRQFRAGTDPASSAALNAVAGRASWFIWIIFVLQDTVHVGLENAAPTFMADVVHALAKPAALIRASAIYALAWTIAHNLMLVNSQVSTALLTATSQAGDQLRDQVAKAINQMARISSLAHW